MSAPKETIVSVVKNRLPSVVKERFPDFASFIEDYYSWCEEDGNFTRLLNDWRTNVESSNGVEPFVDAILKDAGFDLALEDDQWRVKRKSNLLLLLREFYLARGSKQSYDFLFKLLFGTQAQIEYPREMLLVPSSATYGSTFKIFVSAEANSDIHGKRKLDLILENSTLEYGSVSGIVSKTVASIEKITRILSQGKVFLEIDILKPSSDFTVGESVKIQVGDTFIFETIQTTLSFNIISGGNNYDIGDTATVYGCSVVGNASVEAIDVGPVTGLNIINGGTGYSVGDRVGAVNWGGSDGFGFSGFVSEVDGLGAILNITIVNGGYNYSKIPFVQIFSSGTGASILAIAPKAGAVKKIRYTSPYSIPFATNTVYFSSKFGGGADISVVPSTIFNTSDWQDHVGFLGERCHLIDSDKYQQFSYMIISQVDPSRYISAVSDLLHPVGYIRTSVVDNRSEVSLDLLMDTIQ